MGELLMKKRLISIFTVIVMVLSFMPVGVFASDDTSGTEGSKISVSSISFENKNLTYKAGNKDTLKVNILPSEASLDDVEFTSSNSNVVNVDNSGNIAAKSRGSAVITCKAKDGDIEDTCNITVNQPVTSVKLNKTGVSLFPKKSFVLKASIYPSNANDRRYKYTTSNSKVATVTSSGKVTAKSYGSAYIYAAALDGSGKKASCKVNVVRAVTKIKLNKTTVKKKIGSKYQLKAKLYPSNAYNKKVKYYTSDKNVVKVNSKTGKLYFVGPGKATITCKALDGSGRKVKCKVVSLCKKPGWYKKSGKKYYAKKNGTLVYGVASIKGTRYYFHPKTGVMQKKVWKYVKIGGKRYKLYFNSKGKQAQNVDKLIGKQKKYLVTVNTKTNTVIIYAKDKKYGYIIPVKAMVCSTGVASSPTIRGTFKLRRIGKWHELMNSVYGQYCTQISGNYLFHSAWYYQRGNKKSISVSEYKKLGRNASHGCVRLTVADAKWIYDRCAGSTVKVFSTTRKAPLKKPKRPNPRRVSGDRGYCPTDPAFKK
ncbi:ErfK/YbiS/YcfS/YnhG [Anaerofustis stercorihominis DSM 17244]|uniref:ErfK/YbiS/YcfS/YnhG n=2 Tax=Anaerofustis stercorihominis TaxID=214853 RepID=B1CAJ7_9FIRM|nr:ErfK/YbiS/YcfS/YnhG [Anaerofustis stercorihominis DSM 17244]